MCEPETGPSTWREIAEWDWVEVGQGVALHAVASLDDPEAVETDWGGDGQTACGRRGWLMIAGLGARMCAKRCNRCCDATGMPRGDKAPKNVEECRPIVEARISALV